MALWYFVLRYFRVVPVYIKGEQRNASENGGRVGRRRYSSSAQYELWPCTRLVIKGGGRNVVEESKVQNQRQGTTSGFWKVAEETSQNRVF